ncbi:MAG: hypothetical protein K2N51_15540 [Lachnospiraceae bacterium]|nr:hypothetical protein [Lachnospiraceae bacterium]
MKLWIDGDGFNSAGRQIRATVKEMTADINRQVLSRGVRVVNAIRNAELEVLKGKRNGKVLRKKPGTKRRYRPSAPGEPPARRTGNLRLHWHGQVKSKNASRGGVSIVAELESQEEYAGYLENGTENMAPRPFVEKIKEKAKPEIEKILKEPYN